MRREARLCGVLAVAVLVCIVLLAGCTKPPTEEIAKAEKALEGAKAKEADSYLEDGFKKAEAALKKAKDLLAQKEYKDAKTAAEEASSAAQLLSSQVEAAKAKMKTDAEQMLQEVKAQTNELKTLVADAVKRKVAINREEAQTLIGKNEVDLINVKVRLETGKVRQAYDDLKVMKSQTTTQKEKLTAALPPAPEKN
jgi:F0F1-type ATP synthase membrane subunit b/b'